MEIDTQALTTCEVAADGGVISLGFVDSTGNPATIRLSLNQVRARHDVAGTDRQGAADALWRSKPALCLPAGILGRRAIVRSHARHGDAADGRWIQRLLLHPAPAAERARRGAGGAACQCTAAGALDHLSVDEYLMHSFRDAPLGADPGSILTMVVMDSGFALRAPRNDGRLE